ncbi:MAG: hypothetical protein QXX17_07725 [Conexivisphaerales archaeon]
MFSKSKARVIRRRAIAGIVAAVILFAMLFTTGLAFFLFLNSQNLRYSQSLLTRANNIQTSISENLLVTASTSNSYITFVVNNVGGVPSTIVAAIVTNSSGYIFAYYNSTNSKIGLPIALNSGAASSQITTSVLYVSGNTYVIKVLTQAGNVFSATYPPTATSLAAQALSSGAIGDLYLRFSSYTYYTVVSCQSSLSGSSGYCLNQQGPAFTILTKTTSGSAGIAFSIQVTNLNPNQLSITLDQYSLLLQNVFTGSQSFANTFWYIITNKTDSSGNNVIMSQYTPVVLPYNVPVTIIFGSGSFGSFSPLPVKLTGNGPWTAQCFIISHGWKGIPQSQTPNYGQNMPYVTTLYE